MSSGFFALLDDIAALAKVTAASLDDVPAQIAKTSGKVTGIVIDDTAVTPRYVVGLEPSRELSVIYRIAIKSLRNKLLILSPAAILLGYFAPWAISPLLMAGGAYLCFEGYEKVHSMFSAHHEVITDTDLLPKTTPEELENERVVGAVRTDIILSAEIIAIAYSQINGQPIMKQILVMLAVAIFITVFVYGLIALIVKADDVGLHLAQDRYHVVTRRFGRGLVKFMPSFLKVLSYVGTAAMLWVGAEILLHGIPYTNNLLHDLEHALQSMPAVAWLAGVLCCCVAGLFVGFIIEKVVQGVKLVTGKRAGSGD